MTSSTLTYLVRHGEVHNPDHIVYGDLDGYALSELGRAQSAEAAGRLPAGATIVASPLQRAVETAEIIADVIGGALTLDADLTDWRISQHWLGEVWESIDDRFPGQLSAYLEHPHDLPFANESLDDLAARMTAALRHHRDAATGPLVIVSHQDPIQAARLTLTGRSLADLHRDKPGHASVITLDLVGNAAWAEREHWAPAQDDLFPPV